MIRYLFFLTVGTFCAALCGAGYYLGQKIPFVQQWPMFEALRNTAAIIFAVVGAWLAIIYPERLKISFGRRGTTSNPASENVGLLLTPAVHSTIILVCLLMIGIIAPMLKQVPGVLNFVTQLRGVSFALLVILTLWQVAIVVITIFPADLIKSNFDRERSEQTLVDAQDRLIRREQTDS